MNTTYTNLEHQDELLRSITTLEQELSSRLGREVALVAYSPVRYAALSEDVEALEKITELEQLLSRKSGREIALVAFSL